MVNVGAYLNSTTTSIVTFFGWFISASDLNRGRFERRKSNFYKLHLVLTMRVWIQFIPCCEIATQKF